MNRRAFPLDLAAWPARLRQIQVGRQVAQAINARIGRRTGICTARTLTRSCQGFVNASSMVDSLAPECLVAVE
jgi:hypothetical protein